MFTDVELKFLKVAIAIAVDKLELEDFMFEDCQNNGNIEALKEIQSKIERLLVLIADAESCKI